jgi:hypothetical protein
MGAGMPMVSYGGLYDPFGFTRYFSSALTGGASPFDHMGSFDRIFNQRPRMFANFNQSMNNMMYNNTLQKYGIPVWKRLMALANAQDKLKPRIFRSSGGPISYFAGGGKSDTVPAMLTPGEFVMNKSAVDKHGLQFMNSLNRGEIKGFAKGGYVGGTNYLAAGGSPMGGGSMQAFVDVQSIGTAITGAIQSGFANVGSLIDVDALNRVVNSFTTFTNSVSNLMSNVSNMSMTHTVRVDGNINVGGFDSRMIANAIKSEVVNMIITQVRSLLQSKNNDAMNM